ncbi:hypothetical protein Csa_007183 [Cucumis sativus]|uniref:Uncharacterized protein n=1 Tax=Cucumis sativus TaxID=3659 RepID=A0A0A0LYX8_CUCSA|nr:hypothetical protein Csa_007183 [Cucumis sativus]
MEFHRFQLLVLSVSAILGRRNLAEVSCFRSMLQIPLSFSSFGKEAGIWLRELVELTIAQVGGGGKLELSVDNGAWRWQWWLQLAGKGQ